jgi:hypothetical protein
LLVVAPVVLVLLHHFNNLLVAVEPVVYCKVQVFQ